MTVQRRMDKAVDKWEQQRYFILLFKGQNVEGEQNFFMEGEISKDGQVDWRRSSLEDDKCHGDAKI